MFVFLFFFNIEKYLSQARPWKIMRGRKPKSDIRQNVVEILYFLKSSHGYEIYSIYRKIFPKATMRSIYYHLKKGIETREFRIEKKEKEKGSYSWGEFAEKTFYSLGENAKPSVNMKVKRHVDEMKLVNQKL